MVLDLYQSGRAKIGSLELQPDARVGQYAINPSNIRAVDWIALSGMKSNYYHPNQQLAGITLPGTLEKWFKHTGFRQVEDHSSKFSVQEIDVLYEAQKAMDGGAHVCLLVHAELFLPPGEPSKTDAITAFPNHWVVLTSPIQISKWDTTKKTMQPPAHMTPALVSTLKKQYQDAQESAVEAAELYETDAEQIECDDRIRFRVFTWGSDTTPVQGLKRIGGDTTLCYFLRHFYGYIKVKWQ